VSKTVTRTSNAAEANGLILQLRVEFDLSLSNPKFYVTERELSSGILSTDELRRQVNRPFNVAFCAEDIIALERKTLQHIQSWTQRQEQEKERLASIDGQLAAIGFKFKS